jgi:hypothetical protein
MTFRNVFLSLLISLFLTFVVTGIYIIYPLLSLMVINREGNGIGAVVDDLIILLFIIPPASFIVIFSVLQWRSKKS